MASTNNNEDANIALTSPDDSYDEDEREIKHQLAPINYFFCVFHLSMDALYNAVIPNTMFAEFVAHKEDVAPNLLYQQFIERWYKPLDNSHVDHRLAWKAYEDFMNNRWVFQGLIATAEQPDLEQGKIFEAFDFFNDLEAFGIRFYSIKSTKYLAKKRTFIRYASVVYEKLNQKWKLLSSFAGAPPSTFVLPDPAKHVRKYLRGNPNAPLPMQGCADKEEVLDTIYFMEEQSEEDYRFHREASELNTKRARDVGKYCVVASLKNDDDAEKTETKKRSKDDSDDDEGNVAIAKSKKRSKIESYLKNKEGWKFCDAVETDSNGNPTFVGYFHDGKDTVELKASLKMDGDQGTVEEEANAYKTRRREKLSTFFDKQVRRFFEFDE